MIHRIQYTMQVMLMKGLIIFSMLFWNTLKLAFPFLIEILGWTIITGLQKVLEYSIVRNESSVLCVEIIEDNILIKDHYKKYCTILKRVIIEAKKLYFNNQIITSSSKVKIAWKIIKNNSGNSQSCDTFIKINSEEGIIGQQGNCKCI
jgi:hypothetical protein